MKRILAFLLVCMMVFALTGCGNSSSTSTAVEEAPAANSAEEAPAAEEAEAPTAEDIAEAATEVAANSDKDTLYVGSTWAVASLNPWSGPSFYYTAAHFVHDYVMYIDAVTGEPSSDVLEDFYYEDDTTIILKLKDNVYFNNGDKATGEDVLFSMQAFILSGAMEYQQYIGYDYDASYVEDDGLTVVLKTDGVWGPGIGAGTFPLVDKSWVEEVAGWDMSEERAQVWYTDPVACGPFKVEEYVPGASMTLVYDENYWNAENFTFPEQIKKVVLRQYNDASAMYIDLEAGNLDVCYGVSPEDIARAQDGSSPGIVGTTTTTGSQVRLFINMSNNEFARNEDFRKALALGVDWATIGEVAGGVMYLPSPTVLPPSSRFSDPDVAGYEFDPDAAREILAGIDGLDPSSVTIDLVMQALNQYTDPAEMLQMYLMDLGFNVEVHTYDRTALSDLQNNGAEDPWRWTIAGGSCFTGDPYGMMNTALAKSGFAGSVIVIDNDEWNEYANKAIYDLVETAPGDAKYQAMAEWQAYTMDHYLWFPFMEYAAGVAYRSDVFEDVNLVSDMISINWTDGDSLVWAF